MENTNAQADRYARGWNKLKEIDGEAGWRVVDALAPIAPDFARLLIEFPFGDIYSRPQLDLKVSAQLTTRLALQECHVQWANPSGLAHRISS